jgi:hypothetical protein
MFSENSVLPGSGIWMQSVSYRVDDARRPGYKKVVCAKCAGTHTDEPRKSCGFHECEQCGKPYGTPELHDLAREIEAQREEENV